MKKYLLAFLFVFLISCTTLNQNTTTPKSEDTDAIVKDVISSRNVASVVTQVTEADINHIGCAPEEIDENGRCVAKIEDNNAAIFGSGELKVTTETLPLGYIARPATNGSYPGVVMIHEWWGLNDNIKYMARVLASKGYVVYAIDLYNGNVADTSDNAMKYMQNGLSHQDQMTATMKEAVEYLRTLPEVTKVGSLGWCFGGGQSLQLALSGEALDATVIYYGTLTSDIDQLSVITWPVLGIIAQNDSSITPDKVENFENAITELGIQNQVVIYPNVRHAFANPSGTSFAPEETKDAWNKTLAFLDKNLK